MFVVTTWWARSFTRLDSDDAAELFYRIGALPQCRSLFPGELDLNDLFQSPLTQLAWNPHEQAVDGLDHLHRCRGAPAGHTLAYKTPGMVLPGCTIFRLGWPHFPSFFLSLANVKRFSGVPRLKFGASPNGEECDVKDLELTPRSLFRYFGLTTTVHLRAAPTGSARLLERHFKEGWHEEYPA
jgi:hypothetical protein